MDKLLTPILPPPLDKRTGKVTVPSFALPKYYIKTMHDPYVNPVEDSITTSLIPPKCGKSK